MDAPFCVIGSEDQWLRVAHEHTTVDPGSGGVMLSWSIREERARADAPAPAPAGGLAFDSRCRLYRSRPVDGIVERVLWAAADPLAPRASAREPIALWGPRAPVGGPFQPAAGAPAPSRPRGIAVDVDDRLVIADARGRALVVLDLWSERRLRTIALDATPLDVAAAGRTLWVTTTQPAGILRLTARSVPRPVALRARRVGAPLRVAAGADGRAYVLAHDTSRDATWVVPLDSGAPHRVDRGSDLTVLSDGRVIVARAPGEDMRCLQPDGDGWTEALPLTARGYDAGAIVTTPDDAVAYWTPRGLRLALPAHVRYARRGRVISFRLDGGAYGTRWGRLCLDACVPPGAGLRAFCATTDDIDDGPTVTPGAPVRVDRSIARPDLSAPLMPAALVPPGGIGEHLQPLLRRDRGRELAWTRMAADDPFETYESLITAPPGRHLWVALELTGNTRVTPRVRCLRAERPGHDLVRRLPRSFSEEPAAGEFLYRYLALAAGLLGDLDRASAERATLLDPCATPAELLDWLAGFLGLALDERWPVRVRRQVVAAAAELLRNRGTRRGLEQFLTLVLETPVMILEHWRVRGLGGGRLVPGTSAPENGAVIGATFRVGGEVGEHRPAAEPPSVADAFATHAHRFTALVPAVLDAEQQAVAEHVLAIHRPAHTIGEVCAVGTGLRVGLGSHLGLLTVVGRTGAFTPVVAGATAVGRGSAIAPGAGGSRLGAARVGGTVVG